MTILKNMKIGTRMTSAFGTIILMLLIVALVGGFGLSTLSTKTLHTLATDARVSEYSARARANVHAMRQYEKDIILNLADKKKTTEYFNKWEKEYSGCLEKLHLSDKVLYNEDDKRIIKSLKKNLSVYRTGISQLYEETQAGKITTVAQAKNSLFKYKDIIRNIANTTKKFSYEYTEKMHEITGMVEKTTSTSMSVIISTALIALLFSILVSVLITRSITKPLKRGIELAETIARGDFTLRADITQKDELGDLIASLNNSASGLEKMIGSVISSSKNLIDAVEEIAQGNQNLSQRTAEQASSLEEIASTIEETMSAASQNSENANKAQNVSETSFRLASDGGTLVNDAVTSINEINNASKRIEEIINVINEISFQTNLLALNASVEAARAGEQGRGFAVVAGEVRNLAQRSGNAAKEIGNLIQNSVEIIEIGTEKANKSGSALKEIIQHVNEVNNVIQEIAAASSEQRQGITQINSAVTELDSMTQHNASLVEETASASEEISNQSQELVARMNEFTISSSSLESIS